MAQPAFFLRDNARPMMRDSLRHQLARHTDRLAELDFLLTQPDVMADMGQFMKLSREHTEVAAVAGRLPPPKPN